MWWKKNSLAYHLTFRVILFSSLIAICFTLLQLYLDFRQDVRHIYLFFETVKESSLRPLEESVWILDDLQISLQLEGLTKREDIVYAAVSMNGQISWVKGTEPKVHTISQSFPLEHQVRGGREEIGQLHVVASLDGIYHRLLRRIVILLATNTMKTFLVSGFILLLFRKHITGHLRKFFQYVQGIDIQHSPPEPLIFDRDPELSDELEQIRLAFNTLCSTGYQAFRDLRVHEQRLRLFFNATESAILGVDTKGTCIFINQVACEYFAVASQDDLLGSNLFELLCQDEEECFVSNPLVDQVQATMHQGAAQFVDDLSLDLPHGSHLSITLRSYPVIEQEQCTGAIVFFVDTSRQLQLEQEKQLFSKIVRQAPALILIVDPSGKIEHVNRIFEQVMDMEASSLMGENIFHHFKELDLEPHIDEVREKIHKGETWSGIFVPVTLHGRRVVLDAAIFPILDKKGQLSNIVAMGRDITREQQLVEQLHHAQRMEAMGKLAASIAHEFGNPLLGIRFALRDVRQRTGPDSEEGKLLELADNECDRMRKLIRDLQQFNRPSSGEKTRFAPHKVLDEILALHRNLLAKKNILVVLAYSREQIFVHAVEDQMRQVFINLILNASDAMHQGGGTLTLATTVEHGWLTVAIQDTGSGIAPNDREYIFEPFFTTKSAVEGTGLGLPVSYGIIRSHGGRIEVNSEPGNTVFRVILPLEKEISL
nr:ATP-binding protein [uncultured Desulfobulbus sp.]